MNTDTEIGIEPDEEGGRGISLLSYCGILSLQTITIAFQTLAALKFIVPYSKNGQQGQTTV